MDKKYQVFISSTFKDLEKERKKVQEAILDMECIPAGMEHFPAGDIEQFEYIKKVMDLSDYVIIVSANSYGTVAKDGVGYTEKEYWYAKEKGMPILAFLKRDYVGEEKELKKDLLNKFRNELENLRMVKYWNTPEELKSAVITGLHFAFENKPMKGWVRGGENDIYTGPKIVISKEEPEGLREGDIWLQEY